LGIASVPHELAEIVSQSMELKPDGVGGNVAKSHLIPEFPECLAKP
jgi:hypothetical protein